MYHDKYKLIFFVPACFFRPGPHQGNRMRFSGLFFPSIDGSEKISGADKNTGGQKGEQNFVPGKRCYYYIVVKNKYNMPNFTVLLLFFYQLIL